MMNEVRGLLKRQYNNLKVFRAYSVPALFRELFLMPKDLLSGSGYSSSLMNIALFVTMRCNAKCAMCNVSDVLNDRNMPDIPIAKIEKLLDEVKPYGPSIILFGGEPFVRKDIAEIVRAVKGRGMSVGMFTNGTLLGGDTVKAMIREELDYIAFSLQGSKEVHDRVLSVPGAYDKMVEAIKAFASVKDRHTKIIIHSTICELNVKDLRNIARLGYELGADLVRFGHPTFYSREEASRCTGSLRDMFKDDPCVSAMSYIYEIKGKEDIYLDNIAAVRKEFGSRVSFTPELGESELRNWYSAGFNSKRNCLFVWRGLFIYPNGDAYPCESIAYKMGNVFEDGFNAVWNGVKYREFRRAIRKGLVPACARCCKL